MIKCTFIKKNNYEIEKEEFYRNQNEISKMLKDKIDKFFSIKNVDEYIFISRDFTQFEMENLVAPYMIAKSKQKQ